MQSQLDLKRFFELNQDHWNSIHLWKSKFEVRLVAASKLWLDQIMVPYLLPLVRRWTSLDRSDQKRNWYGCSNLMEYLLAAWLWKGSVTKIIAIMFFTDFDRVYQDSSLQSSQLFWHPRLTQHNWASERQPSHKNLEMFLRDNNQPDWLVCRFCSPRTYHSDHTASNKLSRDKLAQVRM